MATGARLVHYVPQNAYIVWTADPVPAEALRAKAVADAAIQFYGDYIPEALTALDKIPVGDP